MAAASFIRAAEDELACPICFELFVNPNTPKTLPGCGHVLCQVCLNQMAAGKCPNDECPECRKPVHFPKDGVASFLTNFRLRNLAEKHQKVVDDGEIMVVEPTTSSEPGQEKSKVDGETDEHSKTLGDRACSTHESELVDFYCITCNMLACQTCVIQKHIGIGHRCERTKEKYDEQKVDMRVIVEKVSQTIQQAKNKRLELITLQQEMQESITTAEKQIDDRVESLINNVFEQSKRLKIQLQQDQQKTVADINHTLVQMDQEIQSAESTYHAAVQSLQNEPDYKYVTRHTSLVEQMKQLRLEECASQICATSYTATRFVQVLAPETLLGRVVSMNPGKARKLKLIQTLDGFDIARTIASSSDGSLLAVCDFLAIKVIIYRRTSTGQYEKSYSLKQTLNQCKLVDVAICSDGRFLVARQTCIEVYTPDGSHSKTINTTKNTSTVVNVHSVTITSNDRILAGDVARSVITEHDSNGNILRTMKTKIEPVHITLIHDTHIAMSDWKNGKVSVIDMQSGQETLSIDVPEVEGICYDEKTDCLLTGRSKPGSEPRDVLPYTGVIEQYCCITGRLVACLTQGLCRPLSIGFLPDGNLVVADAKSVKIYHTE